MPVFRSVGDRTAPTDEVEEGRVVMAASVSPAPPGRVHQPVTDQLREAILEGHYHPRESLVEADLAAEYGAKRSVIRAALRDLAAEGLVERPPNRSARVRSVSIEEAIEITEARLALQALNCAKAAERGSAEDREELRQAVSELRASVERDDRRHTLELNKTLFATIRRMAAHATANRIVEQLENQNVRPVFPFVLPQRRFESLREMEAIAAAVVAGDAEGAYRATMVHKDKVLAALRAVQEGRPIEGAVED